jgi:hypothetical protein
MEINERATVKNVIKCWEKGGIPALIIYLNEVQVFEDTWISKIKNLIELGHINSVNEEIELIAFNIDLKNKLYTKKEKDGHIETP